MDAHTYAPRGKGWHTLKPAERLTLLREIKRIGLAIHQQALIAEHAPPCPRSLRDAPEDELLHLLGEARNVLGNLTEQEAA